MSTSQDLSKPHRCRARTCKGRLVEPAANYSTWAYWHGVGQRVGWFSKPREEYTDEEYALAGSDARVVHKEPSTTERDLAFAYIAGVKIHHESYDNAGADAASAQAEAERLADPGNIYAGMVDYKTFYKLSLHDACVKACTELGHPELGYPVYLGLEYTWNDVLGWAYEVLGIAPEEENPARTDQDSPSVAA